jgi:hypothetical protein
MEEISCTGWYFCNYCKHDDYIIGYFPKNHFAHRVYKTKSK